MRIAFMRNEIEFIVISSECPLQVMHLETLMELVLTVLVF